MYLKREGDYYLIEENEKFVWCDKDDQTVSPTFNNSDEAEFWMFTDGQRKLFEPPTEGC